MIVILSFLTTKSYPSKIIYKFSIVNALYLFIHLTFLFEIVFVGPTYYQKNVSLVLFCALDISITEVFFYKLKAKSYKLIKIP